MKDHKRLKVVECEGPPYEIGKQYGAACKDSLESSIKTLIGEYSQSQNITKQELTGVLKKYIRLTREFDPVLIDQMQGQSDAVGVSLEETFLLRCNFEISFYYQQMKTLCTSFAVTGRATRNGKTIIGQNFDATVGRSIHLVRAIWPEGLKQLSVVFWGACELTLNSAGLGMVLNVVVSPSEDQRLVIPACCVIPKAMRQPRIGDALGVFCLSEEV